MRIERRPYDFEIRTEFPDARLFKVWDGGGAFKAEREGKFFVITDGSTIAEFLDEADQLVESVSSWQEMSRSPT